MLYWVIYDITEDKLRSKVSEKCKDYGMFRIQKSAFIGHMTRNKVEMLGIDVRDIIGDSNDYIFIIPACDKCFSSKFIIGSIDEERLKETAFKIIGGD